MKKLLTLSLVSMFLLAFAAAPAQAAYAPRSGDLIKTADSATVFLVLDDLSRVPVSAEGYAVRYNNDFSRVITVTEAERGSFSANFIINDEVSVANGTLIMYETDTPGIYSIENGFKRIFMTWQGFSARGHDLYDVEWVGTYTKYPTGIPIP